VRHDRRPRWSANRTLAVGDRALSAATGTLEWPRAGDREVTATFTLLPSLVAADEVSDLLTTIGRHSAVAFDADEDSVDGMATHELYLERHGSIDAGLAANRLKPDADPAVLAERASLREEVAALVQPIVRERITPYVRQHVAGCAECAPCFSLVRRYLPFERRSHAEHFDVQAFVTVVVSLSTHGAEFDGGLYVSTGRGPRFLGLRAGDAVVHGSDLLHGVQVTLHGYATGSRARVDAVLCYAK
jgi:hypothetical protein